MPFRRCALMAALLSVAFMTQPLGVLATTGGLGRATPRTTIAFDAPAIPPVRFPVKEPLRVRPSIVPIPAHPAVVQGVRPMGGRRVQGPPLLRPDQVTDIIRKALLRRAEPVNVRPLPIATVNPIPSHRTAGLTRSSVSTPTRSLQSLPGNPTGSGTGINPWWRYQEQNVPGAGHIMVNVGTGNMLLQDDDMSVPHKGIAMSFRRTYNSQSLHDVNGDDGALPGMYGNGWTSTFDAHLTGSNGTINVWDIDGAEYVYTLAADGVTWQSQTAGQHATLTTDGSCGILWTKKSGTTYYFWDPYQMSSCNISFVTFGGYAGRLADIIGRNSNVLLSFAYTWDGVTTSAGKINQIVVSTESGMSTTLTFTDVNGHRLLEQLKYPDGSTTVTYGYDSSGNLITVTPPANNSSGTKPTHTYGYGPLGSGSVMGWATSPRYYAACLTSCGTDGEALYFGFTGANTASSTVASIVHYGVANPTISDGTTNPAVQSGYSTSAFTYLTEYYTSGVTMPTYRDTDGHMTNWVFDTAGRPQQTQECTSSLNQGQQCLDTLHWLTTTETWDVNNNLTETSDARGNKTDYAYDLNGNGIAVAAPQTTTSQGTFRPTSLYDYDAFNNVTAYCDQTETHAAGADWTSAPSPSDTLCSSHNVPHAKVTFTYPSYEAFGELATLVTPLGYTRRVAYATAQQGGTDFGLPTSVTGDSFTQVDNSVITPTQTFWYDPPGNLRCYSKGVGTSVLSYDSLGRMISVADPDDSSANSGSVCSKTSGRAGWNTQTTATYFADGSKQSSQTPAERVGGVSTTFTYDLDGDEKTETHHHGCVTGQTCTPGVTTKWYDGADRLVEVGQPQDPSDLYTYPWLARYFYDLSQGGNDAISTASFRGYGNVFKTQEWVTGPGTTSPSWTDLHGNSFDALDRATAKYTFSPTADTTLSTATMRYDAAPATLGLLSSQTDPLNETTTFGYDALGHPSTVTFSGDGAVTPAEAFVYDADGRQASASNTVYGPQTTSYDADGRVAEVDEPTTGSIGSPARITYDYYANGDRKDLNVASTALTAAPLITYTRRTDGQLANETAKYNGVTSAFGWTDSDGGRGLTKTDPFTGTVMPSPQSPVNAGTVYAATTWSYDTAGQLAGTNLPQTLNYSVYRDYEGNLTASGANVTGNTTFAGGATYWITARGESFQQAVDPWPTQGTQFNSRPANGLLVPAVVRLKVAPSQGSSPVFDPINAVSLGSNLTATAEVDGTPIPCGTVSNIDTYDAASRLVSRPNNSLTVGPDGCDAEGPNTQTWSYDAENHTISQLAGNAKWNSAGKPYDISQTGNPDDYLHYDGGTLLFTTNSQGALTNIKLGALADIAPSGQATVWDRDVTGRMVTGHNNLLYYGVAFGGQQYGPYSGSSGIDSVPGGFVPNTFKGSTNAPGCSSTPTRSACPIPVHYLYTRLDGFDWGTLTIQGVRAVDNTTSQWTTPDAYAGDVHNPASQKPFMWNNNNPYSYLDPSGFYAEKPQVDGAGYVTFLTTAGASGGNGGELAYSPDANLTWADARDVIENVINKLNTGTNPANAQAYLEKLQTSLNYALKNNNNGAYSFTFQRGQPSPTLISKNGLIRIYVSAKDGASATKYRNSIRMDIRVEGGRGGRVLDYRYFNEQGVLMRGPKNTQGPAWPLIPRGFDKAPTED